MKIIDDFFIVLLFNYNVVMKLDTVCFKNNFFNTLNPISVLKSFNPLKLKVLVNAGMFFLGIQSIAAAMLKRKYDGGELVHQPNFSSLKPLNPEFGPFFSPVLRCAIQKLPSMIDQNDPIANPPSLDSLSILSLIFSNATENFNFLDNYSKSTKHARNDDDMEPGFYRKRDMIVSTDEKNLNSFIDKLKKLKCSKKEIEIFKKAFSRVDFQALEFFKQITEEEMKIWKKLGHIPPSPGELEGLMNEFAAKLKMFVQQEIHPIALAAWAHCEIGRIHPFGDGNGRMARLFLNALLVKGGYEPVIFFNDDVYTNAVIEDSLQPGRFAAYLAQLIKEQSSGPQFLQKV